MTQDLCQDGDRCTGHLSHLDGAGDVIGHWWVMIIYVDFKAGAVDYICKLANATCLTRVDQYETTYGIKINILDLNNIVHVHHGCYKKVSQVFFLGARKDNKGTWI